MHEECIDVQWYGKRHLSGLSNTEQIKPPTPWHTWFKNKPDSANKIKSEMAIQFVL